MTRNPRHSHISRMLKIHVYPLKYQKATISANYAKFAYHFRFEQREMEPSKFTANYAKIAQFATPSHESCEIRAILEKSHQSLLPNCTQLLQQIPRNSLTSQRFRVIDAKLTHFALIPTNILVYFSDSRKTDSAPCLRELREFRNLKLNSRTPHNIFTLQHFLQDNPFLNYQCVITITK